MLITARTNPACSSLLIYYTFVRVIRSIMEKGGDLEDCLSTPEAENLSLKLSEEQKMKLPMPGQVDLIVGGPPCQV